MEKTHKGLRLVGQSCGGKLAYLRSMAICAAFLAVLAQITGYSAPWVLIVAAILTCAFLRRGGWRWNAAIGIMLILAVVFRSQVMSGFCRFWNDLGDVYTAGTGVILPELAETGQGMTAFSILAGMAAGVIVSALNGQAWLLLVLCTALAAVFRKMPELTVLGLLTVIMMMKPKKGQLRVVLAPACLLIALTLIARLPVVEGWITAQSGKLHESIHELQHESGSVLPEGVIAKGLDTSGNRSALVVTMEQPETLYLRGFAGAVLEEDVWYPLDTAALQEQEELLYWLNVNEFHLQAQFETAAGERLSNTVTIQNVGACGAYRYLPFTLRADDSLSAEQISPDAVPGIGSYDRFNVVYRGAALVPEVLEMLEAAGDDETHRYLQAEAAYRRFVRTHYLQVFEGSERLSTAWNQAQSKSEQESVLAALELLYPDGAERTPWYATDAVLTLRHFGIPARYAEGYIVPESEEDTMQVGSSQAACWAEVYHDGIGWLPMALTPGLEETEPEIPPVEPPQEEPEQTEEPTTETIAEDVPQPDDGWQVRIAGMLSKGILTALGLILLLLLALYLRRRRAVRERHARFMGSDPREAVGWIFADAITILERMGVRRGNGSLATLEGVLLERFGEEYTDAFKAANALNARSLFSSRAMTAGERETVLSFHGRTLALLKANMKWYQKLWMQWVLCLF